MFPTLPDRLDYPALERDMLERWTRERTFERSLTLNPADRHFTFFEGPPTVNARPGIHHVMARTLKDLVCRYKTMRGYRVQRKAGWDTHGLPVEIALEKELGFKQKSDIESYGVAAFNAKARDLVYHHIESHGGWRALTERMGYWLNLDDAYVTCTNEYIESLWWALKQFYERDLIYKGFKIVPQCPHCETPLSSHELALGYDTVHDPSVFVRCRVTSPAPGSPVPAGAELLVWTTTPWTLISNTALAVHADIRYAVVRLGEATLVLAADRVAPVLEATLAPGAAPPELVATCTGAQLVGTAYQPLFDFVEVDRTAHPRAFTLLDGAFVSTAEGSGIVHIAPAFGQDDYELARAHELPVVQPVTKGGRFAGLVNDRLALNGRLVKTLTFNDVEERGVDRDIVEDLRRRGLLFNPRNRTVGELLNAHEHSYPHCWRCDNPLIYYARDSWFIRTTRFAERMTALNRTINWSPPEIGTGRFGNWLEENKDWALSRDRYWGTPLPIWICEQCGAQRCAGSIADLDGGWHGTRRLPSREVRVDLHRPFVDEVTFTCARCDGTMRRTPELVDVWFDSGAMPFAQWHYPFEHRDTFERNFPADYVCEGVDQTRGWFYTLHAIATGLFDQPAFRNIIVNELILDRQGQKMSKSRGNVVDPFAILDTYGADATRWYLIANSPPWRSTSFNEDDIQDVQSNFFRALSNTYAFLALYANIDGYTPGADTPAPVERPEIDRWILSRLGSVVRDYEAAMDAYDPTRAARLTSGFVIDELSNWYVRRNRRRFWKGAHDADKLAAYDTLHRCLRVACQLAAPFAPFLADDLYVRLHPEAAGCSVHLSRLPEPAELPETDAALEEQMALALRVVSLARSLREKAKIKTRQPLRRVLVPVRGGTRLRPGIEASVRDELNVKAVEYVDGDSALVTRRARPNFKALGRRAGARMQALAARIKAMTDADVRALEAAGEATLDVEGVPFTITRDDVEIAGESLHGWLVATTGTVTVALDTALDEALRAEGDAREFVSHVQRLRKERGFAVTDRINIFARSTAPLEQALHSCASYIQQETLAERLVFEDRPGAAALEINGAACAVEIERTASPNLNQDC